MQPVITYYYAVISGFAYLGERELVRIAKAAGARIDYRPIDIGRVFAESGTTAPATQSPARRANRDIELQRWAVFRGLPINLKPAFWPAPVDYASRLICAAVDLGHDPAALSQALERAVWVDDLNIADQVVCAEILSTALPEAAPHIIAAAEGPQAEAALRVATDQAIAAGAFGSPTYICDNEFFFGQDRLSFLARKLKVS